MYDGIWACASLLYIPLAELPDTLNRLWRALKPGGVCYVSFKDGNGERYKDGRHFTDLNELALRRLFASLTDVFRIECWQSSDVRPERSDLWLNAIIRRKHHDGNHLITGGTGNPFLPSLLEGIREQLKLKWQSLLSRRPVCVCCLPISKMHWFHRLSARDQRLACVSLPVIISM